MNWDRRENKNKQERNKKKKKKRRKLFGQSSLNAAAIGKNKRQMKTRIDGRPNSHGVNSIQRYNKTTIFVSFSSSVGCVCVGGTPTRSRLPNQQQKTFVFLVILSLVSLFHTTTQTATLSLTPFCLSVCCPAVRIRPTHRVAGERKKKRRKKMGKRERRTRCRLSLSFVIAAVGAISHTAAALSQSLLSFLPCDLMITIFSLIPLQPLNLIIKERNKTKRTQSKNKNKK